MKSFKMNTAKSLMYRNAVISALIINIAGLVLSICSIFYDEYWLMAWLPIVGFLNRKIIDNGENINKQKKRFILLSCFFMIICFLAYGIYMFKVRQIQIINGL